MNKALKIEDAPELQNLVSTQASPEFPFVGLDIKRLTSAGKNLNCDVFIKISDAKMTRIFSVDTGLDFIRLRQYIDKGVKEVFIRQEDLGDFSKYLRQSPHLILQSEAATKDEKVNALLDLADQNVSDFFTKLPLPDVSVEKTKEIIRRMVTALSKDPGILGGVIRMAQHHDFMMSHAVSVSVIAMLIARGAESFSERTLELCGIGGFLHDLGKSQISPEIVPKYSDLTPEQWKEMRHHCLLGVKMLERCENAPEEVKQIILHHHEQPGGGGYPAGIRGPRIFYPAKIVAIADTFSAMISNESYLRTFTPEQALAEMHQEPGRYDKELLRVVGKMFRIKTI